MNICLLSSERSGSNLLRLLLSSHTDISAPPAPQIVKILGKYIHRYGDLNQDNNWKQLLSDMIDLTIIHPYPWQYHISVQELAGKAKARNFWSAWNALYALNTELEGKKYWLSKENNLFDYAWEIACFLPETKFIYLVRDGRDYACSSKQSLGGDCHYYFIAKKWKEEQIKCLNIYYQLKEFGLVYLVRYEDMIADPEVILREISGFLGIEYQRNMFDYNSSPMAKEMSKKSKDWENLSKPIMADNSNKFRKIMSKNDIKLFESVARKELLVLGYQGEASSLYSIPNWKRMFFYLENMMSKKIKYRKRMKEEKRLERTILVKKIEDRLINEDAPFDMGHA